MPEQEQFGGARPAQALEFLGVSPGSLGLAIQPLA
jgi:hypothetical protein